MRIIGMHYFNLLNKGENMTIFDDIYGRSFPFAIGFDRTLQLLEKAATVPSNVSYPPYNIVKIDDESYSVELAVAGFKKDEISISKEAETLTIEGKVESKEEKEFVHKGLASRSFKRTFTLAEEIVVEGAKLEDGILSVSLKRVIPEEKKPVSIKIS